jgi:uncharacterized protein (TIGR00730 family)
MKSLCVFCGSSSGVRKEYVELAQRLGRTLAEQDIGVVYGGGRVGLMGAVANAALEAGGRVIGVIPQLLMDKEVGHTGLTELHVVETMAQRKWMMGELSDAFLALPGGIGTMDELFEAWTWTQLDLHDKPCGLLNFHGYYDSLIHFLDNAVVEGFLRPRHRAALVVGDDLQQLLDELRERSSHQPP